MFPVEVYLEREANILASLFLFALLEIALSSAVFKNLPSRNTCCHETFFPT